MALKYPWTALIEAAYSGGKLIANSVFATEDTLEQYHKLQAVLNLEDTAKKAVVNECEKFKRDRTHENAEEFLSSIDIMFDFVYQDCEEATKYLDVMEEGLANKLLLLLGKNKSEEKKTIANIKTGYGQNQKWIQEHWINNLNSDYPGTGLYEFYKEHAADLTQKCRKEVSFQCPVNIAVYNSDKDLVASIKDGQIYSTDNVISIINGDKKTIYTLDDKEYTFIAEGYDDGTMDVDITEYGNEEEVIRKASFNDIPVSRNKSYSVEDDDGYKVKQTGQADIIADFDTTLNRDYHTAKVANGYFISEDGPASVITASSGEVVSVTAFIPAGYHLDSWDSSIGKSIFESVNSITTSFRMGDKDIEVYPVIAKDSIDGDDLTGHTHNWDGGKVTTAATCMKEGVKTYTCSVCGATKTEVIPKLSHKLVYIAYKAPTSSTSGNTDYYCTTCGKYFSATNNKKEITKNDWTIPVLSPKKAKQKFSVTVAKKTVKYSKLKKKSQKIKPIKVHKSHGKLTYKIVGGTAKGKKALKINKKTGKITVKKGSKKGNYKIKVKIHAKGDDIYKTASKTVTVNVKVK